MTSPAQARETDSGRLYHYNGPETPLPPIDYCGILHVRPDKCELTTYDAGFNDFRAFLACRELWDWHYPTPLESDWFVSVTNAIAMINKPNLVAGARKVQAVEILERPGYYTDMLIQDGFEAARMHASRNAKARWDRTSDLGSRVHASIEQYLAYGPESGPFDDDVQPFIDQFDVWLKKEKPTVLYSEVTGYNRKFKYAGTIDLIVTMESPFSTDTWLIDVKSGSSLWPEMAIQLAAYRNFEFLGIDLS